MAKSKPNLYCLHVGINTYPKNANVSNLKGCVNDAWKISAFIDKQYSKVYKVHPKMLLDKNATYDNIVDAMGSGHLGKAGKGDIVFFTFSGHGSREPSAAEFKDPGGKGETLVCYDSRPKGMDLADKELAVLMKRIEEKGVYIVTLLDCCHSGSGFRGDDAALGQSRQCYDRNEIRPLKAYLNGYYHDLKEQGKPMLVPLSRQLNLSACDRTEKAYEHGNHGLFTFCLLEVLKKTPRLSYAKLFERTQAMMASIADKQQPQFESTGQFNSFEVFLRPGDTSEQIRHNLKFDLGKWKVDMGSLHGVPAAADIPATFAIYPTGADKPIGYATAEKVGFQSTKVKFEGKEGESYDAKLISMPDPALVVHADKATLKRLKKIHSTHPDTKAVFADLDASAAKAKYDLAYEPGQIKITNTLTGALVKGFTTSNTGEDEHFLFKTAFECLDHLAQWERLLALEKSSRDLSSEGFKFELFIEGVEKPVSDSATIQLYGQDGVFEKVNIRVNLDNPLPRDLHFSLLYLRKDYSVRSIDTAQIGQGKKDILNIPVKLDKDEYEYTFYFKLIVSTDPIHSQFVEMKALQQAGQMVNIDHKGGLDFGEEEKQPLSDWFTKTMEIKLVGIDRAVNASEPVSLEEGKIRILPNKKISAKVNTTVVDRGNHRSTGWLNVLPRLIDDENASFIQPEGGTRSASSNGPVVLNLEELTGTEHISDHPLELEITEKLSRRESLVPITFDGEKIVVLGSSKKVKGGKVKVTIDQMPDKQPSSGTRSPGKALWLYFLKVMKVDTQRLCAAAMAGGKVKRNARGLRTKVKNSKRILMVIHGIIGDTKGMAQLALEAKDAGLYDLILTFDYENLNTPINKTAEGLQAKLEKAGVTSDHEFTILAHSMGGLVSRYYVEKLGGNEVVNHLILAGTPNLGSNFGKVTQYLSWASKVMGIAGAAGLTLPYSASIISFLAGVKKITVTLAQMNYDDPGNFLKDLEKSEDPGIPYTVIAGILSEYMKELDDPGTMDKILDTVANLFNGQTNNDIAVELDSIKGLIDARQHPPKKIDVACHHLNYFSHPAGAIEVRRAIGMEVAEA